MKGLDTAGIAASLLCAVHCAALPVLAAALPMRLASPAVEWGLLAVSAAIGAGAVVPGYRRHRNGAVPALLASGLILALTGRLLEAQGAAAGVLALVAGGLTVAAAHAFNHRACHHCALPQGKASVGANQSAL